MTTHYHVILYHWDPDTCTPTVVEQIEYVHRGGVSGLPDLRDLPSRIGESILADQRDREKAERLEAEMAREDDEIRAGNLESYRGWQGQCGIPK